jgi:hypothetical protein
VEKNSCPPFDPQTKVEEKPSEAWSEQIYHGLQCPTSSATLLAKQILPNLVNLPAKVVYNRPQSRYPREILVQELRSYFYFSQMDTLPGNM